VSFRVWAPSARRVRVEVDDAGSHELSREAGGYFSGTIAETRAGALYRLRLDERGPFPDPASRFQPEGPFGPSAVVDPASFSWSDSEWGGPEAKGQIVYEVHVGTFTPEGTWEAAIRELPRLRDVGITTIEVMPVAEFPGAFGWGYDGVDLWAPTRLYGSPDDFRSFVDAAHGEGLAVVLDVVYNHIGPSGNFLKEFADAYFTDRYENDWGEALDFDGPSSGPVREFFAANAAYWIAEFHLDGLRLDATQSIHDAGDRHVIAEIADAAREAAGERRIWLVAENEPQDVRTLLPAPQGGHGLDAAWNDDFHHSAAVALTGRHDAYYTDYLGAPQEFISAAKWGFLYQGQRYLWQKKRRGTAALGIPAHRLVCYLENHDQIANSARGERLWRLTDGGSLRAMTALLLLSPSTPMLFQGQEFHSSRPFLYFADHERELAEKVQEGRAEFLTQFRSIAAREMARALPRPHDRSTFEACKLDSGEAETNAAAIALHRDLIELRRSDPAFEAQEKSEIHGAVLSADAFALRWIRSGHDDRLLIVNLGRDLHLSPAPEPLLAPPAGCRWEILWSSESPLYGGSGTPEPDREGEGWHLRGRAALVLEPAAERRRGKDRES
jgi:maltooligosyltrehalose trehalohydrolase